MGQAMPLHPHNALVQIWLELGLIGLLLIAAVFSLIVVSIPESANNRAATSHDDRRNSLRVHHRRTGFWYLARLVDGHTGIDSHDCNCSRSAGNRHGAPIAS